MGFPVSGSLDFCISDFWVIRSLNFRYLGFWFSDLWVVGFLESRDLDFGFQISGSLDFGILDFWIAGFLDFWILDFVRILDIPGLCSFWSSGFGWSGT